MVYDDGAYTDIALKNMRKLICPCRIVVGDVVVKDKTVTPKSIRYEVMQSPGAGALARSDIISIRPVKSEDAPSEVKVENAVLVLTKATLRDRQMTDEELRAFSDCACESDEEETVIVTASRTVKRSVSVTETKQIVRPRPRFYRDFDLEDIGSPTKLKSDLLRGFGLVFSKADGPEPTSNVSISQRAHFAGACLLDKVADLFDTSATQQASQHDTTMRFAADDDTSQLSTILLISSEPSTTVKYLEALALGIPCVASQWVTDCCDAGELIDWQLYCRELNVTLITSVADWLVSRCWYTPGPQILGPGITALCTEPVGIRFGSYFIASATAPDLCWSQNSVCAWRQLGQPGSERD